jgi:hypothetical protein
MKKLLIVMLAFGLMGALIIAPPAGAALLNELSPVNSPDTAFAPSYVDLQAGGDLVVGGGGWNLVNPIGDYQLGGLFGVGASLAQFDTAVGFDVSFDTELYSWDDNFFGEEFIAAITQGGQYWDSGTVVVAWEGWAGSTIGVLDPRIEGYGLQMTVNNLQPADDYYFFAGLQTIPDPGYPDGQFPSWGTFSAVTIDALMEPGPGPEPTVPEPSVIILLGLGVIGLAGLRRKL